MIYARSLHWHPKYFKLKYDVGLVRLAKSVHFSSSVRPVRLPDVGATEPAPGTNMTISGWGKTNTVSGCVEDSG